MPVIRRAVLFGFMFSVFDIGRRPAGIQAENSALSILPDAMSSDEDADGIITEENSDITESLFGNVFVPTGEWKKIEPGQAIPTGLHVRMNMETGEREAKLMNGNDGENMKYWKNAEGKQGMINSDGSKSFTKSQLKEALKKFEAEAEGESKTDDESAEESVRKKFRSYDELKQELAQLRLNVKTDLEVLRELLVELRHNNTTDERKLSILEDLEYLVHQVDNAQNFVDMDGFSLLSKLLNYTEPQFRQWAAFVIGSAAQSNPKVQVAALESGILHHLIRVFQSEQSVTVRRKYLFAISAILRRFPFAQKKFLELGGFEVLRGVLQAKTAEESQQLKIVTLVSDLLIERQEIEDRAAQYSSPSPIHHQSDLLTKLQQYREVPLRQNLLEGSWCESIADLLATPDQDGQEKVLRAMHAMLTDCKAAFTGHTSRLMELEETYRAQLVDDDDNEFLVDLVNLVRELLSTIRLKDEL